MTEKKKKEMTATEAAQELNVQPEEVRRLCRIKRLDHSKHGRAYLITRDDLQKYKKNRRSPGRPRKED